MTLSKRLQVTSSDFVTVMKSGAINREQTPGSEKISSKTGIPSTSDAWKKE